MNYLYRIVNALLAIAMFPVVIFSDLIAFRAGASFVEEVGLQDSITIKFIIDIFTGKEVFFHEMLIENSTGSFIWPTGLDPIKAHLIAVLAGFAVALLACVFIFFWSIFSNKRIPVLIATAVGIISTIVMIACFDVVATRIVDGTVNLIGALSTSPIASLIGGFVSIDGLMLGGFQNGMIFVFVGFLLWTGSYYLIEIGDNEEDKKKAKKATAKKEGN